MDNTMTALADLDGMLSRRGAVIISAGVITAGRSRSSFAVDDPSSLLTTYLRVIRSMRRQKRAPEIALRRDDIDVVARYLDLSSEETLDRLATLMGATAAQRSAIASMFASGALVVSLAAATAVAFVGLPAGQAAAATAQAPADAADGVGTDEGGFVYDIGTPAGYPDAADIDGAYAVPVIDDIGTPAAYADASSVVPAEPPAAHARTATSPPAVVASGPFTRSDPRRPSVVVDGPVDAAGHPLTADDTVLERTSSPA